MNGANWTGRTPRTTQQAFGPYTSAYVEPMQHQPRRWERIADALFAVALGIVGCAVLITWWAQ